MSPKKFQSKKQNLNSEIAPTKWLDTVNRDHILMASPCLWNWLLVASGTLRLKVRIFICNEYSGGQYSWCMNQNNKIKRGLIAIFHRLLYDYWSHLGQIKHIENGVGFHYVNAVERTDLQCYGMQNDRHVSHKATSPCCLCGGRQFTRFRLWKTLSLHYMFQKTQSTIESSLKKIQASNNQSKDSS